MILYRLEHSVVVCYLFVRGHMCRLGCMKNETPSVIVWYEWVRCVHFVTLQLRLYIIRKSCEPMVVVLGYFLCVFY